MNETPGAQFQPAFAHQTDARLTNRRDAGTDAVGEILHDEALPRPEVAGDQTFPQVLIGPLREVASIQFHANLPRPTASLSTPCGLGHGATMASSSSHINL